MTTFTKGTVIAVCTAPAKGVQKKDRGEALLVPGKGIEGDGHFGFAHRQVSLLDAAEIERMKRIIPGLFHGAFAENIVTEGIDLAALTLGDRLRMGGALLRVTQLGKECHNHCAIYEAAGDCIMPKLGIFCEVLTGGAVRRGDTVELLPEPDDGAEALPGERNVTVLLDGERVAEGVCTHGMEHGWAVGRLVALGLLRRRDDMGSLEIRDDDSVRTVAVTKKKAGEPAALQKILARREGSLSASLETVANRLNGLTGAVLLDAAGGEIVRTMDADGTVAMEKAIGWAVLRNVLPDKTALLVTAPLTAATVRTALRAGVSLLAGTTRPTTQAVEAAGGKMHLAGRGREGETVRYA